MKKILVIALLLVCHTVVMAQEKIYEGVITAKQTFTTDDEAIKAQLAMMGEVISTTYFKGTKSRVEISNPMSGDVTVITDSDNMENLTLMDNPMMGKKFMSQKMEVPKEMLENIKVEEGSKTKTILGFECKEHIISISQDGNTVRMIMYTTDKIIPVMSQQTAQLGDKVTGFPMYMEATVNQGEAEMVMITEVTEVKSEKVDDSKFSMTPPEGYTKMEGM